METLRISLSCFGDTLVLACRALGTGKMHLVCTLCSSPGPHNAVSCRSPAMAPPLPPSSSPLPVHLPARQRIPCSTFLGPWGPPSWPLRSLRWLGFLHRTKEDCDVPSHVVPPSLSPEEQCASEVEAPLDSGPAEVSAPSVYETLQCRLSSLEAVVAAWRHHSVSFPRPVEAEDRDQGAPESFGDEEEAARAGRREAARLTERNAWLRLALDNRDDELALTRASLQDALAEKETLQRQVSW